MADLTIRMDGRFKKQLRLAFKNSHADVGILVDKPHKKPVAGATARRKARQGAANSLIGATTLPATYMLKSYAGGPARKTGRGTNGTLSSVSRELRANTGINIFTSPWKSLKNKEIVKFANQYVKRLLRPKEITGKRVENLLQAVVRNPIIRGDYGKNSSFTAKIKGFNRFMIDTAQLVQNIKAKVVSRVQKRT